MGVIIRVTTRPSRKCELIKLSVPLVSSIYAYAAFTVAASITGTVFPMNYGPYHLVLLLNVDSIHICYHYNFFFLNLLLFV